MLIDMIIEMMHGEFSVNRNAHMTLIVYVT